MKKYLFIEESLRQRILSGEFKIGKKLPKHEQLAKNYHTSRVTLSRALKILSEEGLIITRRGEGSFVRSNSYVKRRVDETFKITKNFLKNYKNMLVSFDIRECDDEERNKLKLSAGELVYDIIRLRSARGTALEIEYTIMPKKLMEDFDESICEHSIYDYLQNELNYQLGYGRRTVRADKSDVYDCMYLGLEKSEPVLEIEQLAYLRDGRPFEISHTRFPYDKLELIYEIDLDNNQKFF